ncbi:hypothetical protein NQ314_016201, partial [Rhamnusium bicolor]
MKLESWFKTGATKKPQGQRPTSTLTTRPNSETDIVDADEEYNKMIETMSEKDVNVRIEELLSDMNLNDDKKKPLRDMPLDQKKAMLVMQNKKKGHQETGNRFNEPEDYHKYLEQHINSEYTQLYKFQNCVESLKVALANNPLSWVEKFGSIGLQKLLQVLEIGLKYKDVKLQTECLRCLEKFMNNTTGLKAFFNNNKGHETVAKCLDHEKPQVMIQALKILAPLCFLDEGGDEEGSKKVLMAITKVGEKENRERFLPVVNGITKTNYADLQSMCFQFINALLSETEDFEFRMHLRNEIVRNGLYEKLQELKNETNPLIKTHFDIFENRREDDADELHERFDKVRLDMDDIHDCFEVLKNVTLETPSEPYFLSILQHLLFIRDDIVLHKSGLDPDFKKNHIDIDLQPLLDELKDKPLMVVDSAEVEGLKKQLEEALAAKTEAEAKLDLVQGRAGGPDKSGKLDPALLNKVNVPPPPPPPPGMGGPPPPPMPGMGGGPPPPPMPGMGGPPPPPMPGMGGPPPTSASSWNGPDLLPHGLKPKKKWEVTGPLKRANWKTIIPQKMSEKSFWIRAKEEELAEPDILDGLAKKFSSKPAKAMEDVTDKSSNFGTLKKVKELNVLDGKSAQNILILLNGSLKHMAYDDIKKALLRCDENVLSENITEQLIQYLPPADQLNKLQSFKDKYDDLAEAEQFCVKMSEVKRLLPRLKSLSFKHHYVEMVQDTKPDIVAATAACEEVKKSKKFARILELILLMGNYMNSGSRNAQAFGFEMSFLTKKFAEDAREQCDVMQKMFKKMESHYNDLSEYYAFDKQKYTLEEFFTDLKTFKDSFI